MALFSMTIITIVRRNEGGPVRCLDETRVAQPPRPSGLFSICMIAFRLKTQAYRVCTLMCLPAWNQSYKLKTSSSLFPNAPLISDVVATWPAPTMDWKNHSKKNYARFASLQNSVPPTWMEVILDHCVSTSRRCKAELRLYLDLCRTWAPW